MQVRATKPLPLPFLVGKQRSLAGASLGPAFREHKLQSSSLIAPNATSAVPPRFPDALASVTSDCTAFLVPWWQKLAVFASLALKIVAESCGLRALNDKEFHMDRVRSLIVTRRCVMGSGGVATRLAFWFLAQG